MSYKITDILDTFLAKKFGAMLADGSASTAAHPLVYGTDAFLARIALVKLAEKSLDLQYYIWNRDATGTALMANVLDAADRGVRVRLLLDDIGSNIGDKRMRMLSQHPNISIRLFNPATDRKKGLINLLSDFNRINRRMHNKSLTVDNTVSVVGGRNIGDEYFDAKIEFGFSDLDLMVVGEVVDEVSDSFDIYWNFTASHPIEKLSRKTFSKKRVATFYKNIRIAAGERLNNDYLEQLKQSHYANHKDDLQWFWGEAALVFDHPDKILSDHSEEQEKLIEFIQSDKPILLSVQLVNVLKEMQSEMIVVSPYLVPGDQGVQFFKGLTSKNIRVIAITNSLAATDISAVHAGYARYRKQLLRAGVELYELRADVEQEEKNTRRRRKSRRKNMRLRYRIGSAVRASLHAKAFFFDRKTTFIGSLNLDPRSLFLNTEVGVVLDNDDLASMASDTLQAAVQTNAYRVTLDDNDKLVWTSRESGEICIYHSEPKSSVWRRMGVWLIGLFPIESQL